MKHIKLRVKHGVVRMKTGGCTEARKYWRVKGIVPSYSAVGSLLLASFAVKEVGDLDAEGAITDELIERVSKAFQTGSEG
jgi:hypothetical protein